MRSRNAQRGGWDDDPQGQSGYYDQQRYDGYDGGDQDDYYDPAQAGWDAEEDARGLVLQQEQSLVGVSNTVTQHGVPLLSYSRTMSRFYNNRKQRLSLGRFKCEVCGQRIRFWAWQNETGKRTHDGCYERLAWTWTNVYAMQQQLASEGRFE
jgi:hypothetical protein